jgi:predicted DNA-binding protein
MIENLVEKQIAIKLSENYIFRLDDLAKRGNTNRRQLMVNFINIWINELKEINKANFFHLAIVLKGIEADMEQDDPRRAEFVESNLPEKPFPIILSRNDSLYIISCASRANMTRHYMMKSMVITGIDELEELTDKKEYDFSVVEPKLKRAFGIIMAKGVKAYREGIREKSPLKRN